MATDTRIIFFHQSEADDFAFHPVTERPLHVDFLRISEHAKVTVQVPVHFKNEGASPGIKNARDRQLMLQYLFSIGAHGAHKF